MVGNGGNTNGKKCFFFWRFKIAYL